jgi:hypothetical protein
MTDIIEIQIEGSPAIIEVSTSPRGQKGDTGAQGPTGATGSAGIGYDNVTSTSSITIGSGIKTFTLVSSYAGAFTSGSRIRAIHSDTPTYWMEGYANYIGGGTLILSVDKFNGSGSHNLWRFSIAGEVGNTGATGPQGATGATGPQGPSGVAVSVTSPITNTGTPSSAVVGLDQSLLTIAQSQVTNLTTDLAAKAPLASPAFTGTPTTPTASQNDNSTQIASTAFVWSNALMKFASTTSVRTNLVPNPSFETNTTTWTSTGTLTRVSTQSKFGTYCGQVVCTATNQTLGILSANFPAVSASTVYTASLWFDGEAGKTVTFEIREADAAKATITTTVIPYTATGEWQRFSGTVTTRPNTAFMTIIVRSQSAHTYFIDGVFIEAGANLQPYFDGSFTSARNVAYAWTGTAHASTSTETRTIGTAGSADFIYSNSVQSNTQQLLVNGVDYDLIKLGQQNQDRTTIETVPRALTATTQTLTSGNVFWAFFTAPYTATVSQIYTYCSTAAVGTTRSARMGLYTFDGAIATLVAQTALDSSSLFWTVGPFTRSFDSSIASTYTVQAGQRYAIGIVATATGGTPTEPAIVANGSTAALTALAPRMSGSAVVADLPATQTAAGLTAQANTIWARVF